MNHLSFHSKESLRKEKLANKIALDTLTDAADVHSFFMKDILKAFIIKNRNNINEIKPYSLKISKINCEDKNVLR